jgi:hypothetical protein
LRWSALRLLEEGEDAVDVDGAAPLTKWLGRVQICAVPAGVPSVRQSSKECVSSFVTRRAPRKTPPSRQGARCPRKNGGAKLGSGLRSGSAVRADEPSGVPSVTMSSRGALGPKDDAGTQVATSSRSPSSGSVPHPSIPGKSSLPAKSRVASSNDRPNA